MKLGTFLMTWALTAAFTVPVVAYNLHRPFHHSVNAALALMNIPGARQRVGPQVRSLSSQVPVKVGDRVAGFRISSQFGDRTHPIDGYRKPHLGTDVQTPIGTPVYALADASVGANVRVTCWSDPQGGLIALISSDLLPGQTIKLMHLQRCFSGVKAAGEQIALTGATGKVTGPHLHVEQINALGQHSDPAAGILSWLLTGQVPDGLTAISHSAITDEDLICSIGAAEGTRDTSCRKTDAYRSHIDPGNGVTNQGNFSYQHEADSAEDADAKQMFKLRHAEKTILQRAEAAGITLEKMEVLSILDQFNQSEAAAFGRNGTLDRIIAARAESYINPDTGRLDAPGLGNDMARVKADQMRRTEAISESLANRRLRQMDR